MDDDTPGTICRGLFKGIGQDAFSRAVRMSNAEYRAAFQFFDADRTGGIDVNELSRALQQVQQAVDSSAQPLRLTGPRPFNLATCCWLCGRFGGGSMALNEQQFCDLMEYIKNMRAIFEEVDADRSGSITSEELQQAFKMSGVSLDQGMVDRIGQSFDFDKSGTLEFDEFVQMRLEWDMYVAAWDQSTQGRSSIAPAELLGVLEEIKRSLDPVGTALHSAQGDMFLTSLHGLLYLGMFTKLAKPFQPQTAETLIIRFGEGNFFLNFAQFCAMMVFLKEMKTTFCKLDQDRSGTLDMAELSSAFAGMGMSLPQNLVAQIGQTLSNNEGAIEFDEFVQIAAEWNEMWQVREQSIFGAEATGRISAQDLQKVFGSVRVCYRVVNQAVLGMRSFSLNACRWLVAKFGTALPGEHFAQGVSWLEFLALTHYVKECYRQFAQYDLSHTGRMCTTGLGMVMSKHGLNLNAVAVDTIRRSFDADGSGSVEFDEFLQILMECQWCEQTFISAAAGQELVTLDRSAFCALVFAMPRSLSQ